jgi:hypothetical protein
MRFVMHGALILTVMIGSAACQRHEANDAAVTKDAAVADRSADGDEITVTGCLTSAPDRSAYAVTASRDALTSGTLQAGTGEVPTYTYALVGGTDLQAHVGRQVEVRGRVDDDGSDEVDVDTKDKVELPQARVGGDTVTPAIETKEEVELEVRRLHVTSVTPTGRSCQPTPSNQ